MKKQTIAELVILLAAIAGIAIWYFTRFEFGGGVITGATSCLLFFSRKGRKQLDRAAAIIDKALMDYKNQNHGTEKNLPE